MKQKFLASIVIIFLALTGILYWLKVSIPAYQFSVLEAGNIIMASLSFITYLLVGKEIGGTNTQAFIRGVYSSSFLKLMVCMVAILVYVLLNREHIHKPSVFVLFGIYAVYTTSETWVLSKTERG